MSILKIGLKFLQQTVGEQTDGHDAVTMATAPTTLHDGFSDLQMLSFR